MLKVIKQFVHDLLYSPEKATLWFRGITTWFAASAALVVAYPVEVIQTWHLRDWALRWLIASITAIPMMKKAGDRNVPPPTVPPAP